MRYLNWTNRSHYSGYGQDAPEGGGIATGPVYGAAWNEFQRQCFIAGGCPPDPATGMPAAGCNLTTYIDYNYSAPGQKGIGAPVCKSKLSTQAFQFTHQEDPTRPGEVLIREVDAAQLEQEKAAAVAAGGGMKMPLIIGAAGLAAIMLLK